MTKVIAGITTSIDGYIAGPGDGPGNGLGDGGERLHHWVVGPPEGEPDREDVAWLEQATSRLGAVVAGRSTYEASERWGGESPWDLPFFIVTHRPEPDAGGFTFVEGVEKAVERARESAGDKDVSVMGGADTIRQALEAGLVDELSIIIAPVILGGGKHLFEGFTKSLDLEQVGVRQSQHATFVDYRVKRS